MDIRGHLVVGSVGSVLPDFFLWFFYFRKKWLPETHLLVRCHRFLHSYKGLILIFSLAFSSHIIIDWFSRHRNENSTQN